jgi:integrase
MKNRPMHGTHREHRSLAVLTTGPSSIITAPKLFAAAIALAFAGSGRDQMKVQQELMRHASIQTTMNVYIQARLSSKREANGKVMEMVLKPVKASA